jgi:hypothetical protein
LLIAPGVLQASTPLQLAQQLNDYPHAQIIDFVEEDVIDYEIGLGAIQKISGAWKFKHSERFSGKLTRFTWQIVDGFSSIEVMDELRSRVAQLNAAEPLFSCEGRGCGRGVQWANRVFQQRLLYGREDRQRYVVYSFADPRSLLVIYASARSADRQYLHVEVLDIAP